MEALLAAFRGPLADKAGALDMMNALQKFMNSKSKEIAMAELEHLLESGASATELPGFDIAKLQKNLRICQSKGSTNLLEGEERVNLVDKFLHNAITLLYRKDGTVSVFHFNLFLLII